LFDPIRAQTHEILVTNTLTITLPMRFMLGRHKLYLTLEIVK